MNTTLVELHDCIKDGDVVVIRSIVVEGRHGKIVRLVAHRADCKKGGRS